jgi:hypothetical protein
MGMHQMSKFLTTTAGIALAIGWSSAIAATDWSYNLSTQCAPGVNSGAHTAECGVSNPDLTLSGWSTATGATTTPGSAATFAAASIYDWGSSNGLGIVNTYENQNSTGPHAIDNQYGTDAILLSFTNAVNLTSVGVGWVGGDSDFSVLAYTGSGEGTVSGKTLLSNGWTVVANYANISQGSSVGVSAKNSDNTLLYSSYWLVSAYAATYGENGPKFGSPFGSGNDYFKLLSVAGNNHTPNNETPEPGSIALFGAGLFGLMALRRRRQTEN